jgi:hypothetical protein
MQRSDLEAEYTPVLISEVMNGALPSTLHTSSIHYLSTGPAWDPNCENRLDRSGFCMYLLHSAKFCALKPTNFNLHSSLSFQILKQHIQIRNCIVGVTQVNLYFRLIPQILNHYVQLNTML